MPLLAPLLLITATFGAPTSDTVTLAPARDVPAAIASLPRREAGEATFDSATRIDGQWVPLRAASLLRYWGFKVYSAALYVSKSARSADDVLGPTPKRLVLQYHRSIGREDIIKASLIKIASNPANDMEALRGRLEQLHAQFRTVQEGDRFELIYSPGKGSALVFNGKALCVIPGDDFMRAYFGIWLGEYALDEDLRSELLAGGGTS